MLTKTKIKPTQFIFDYYGYKLNIYYETKTWHTIISDFIYIGHRANWPDHHQINEWSRCINTQLSEENTHNLPSILKAYNAYTTASVPL